MAKKQGYIIKSCGGKSTTGSYGTTKETAAMRKEEAEKVRDKLIEFGARDAVLEPIDTDFVED